MRPSEPHQLRVCRERPPPPPHLSLGSVPKSCNPTINEDLERRLKAVRIMKEELIKAQARMKKYADMKKSERKFHVSDWVYLRLQLYRQISMKDKIGTHKLLSKFYGPFEILEKVGQVAYKLNLPSGSSIHDVFYVSQLKKKLGTTVTVGTRMPLVSSEGRVKLEPIAILDRRVVKKNNQVEVEVLVQ
jgi:ribosomal protein S19E (S16A)